MEIAARKIKYSEFRQMEFEENDRFLYELLNGEIVKKSAPSPLHQPVSRKLSYQLETVIAENII